MTATALRLPDPATDATALRLLRSTARQSYDPEVDLDWDAPLVDGAWFMQPERLSLYGTSMWDAMSREQQVELSKHEIASIASVGLWFELILLQILARELYDEDPCSERTHYALTEIGDETRHAIMFGKGLSRLGLPAYGPPKIVRSLSKVFGAVIGGPAMFASVLVVEETTDRLQRSMLDDEAIQPFIRMINRIHVVEEARHVRYAREELVRGMSSLSKPALELHRFVTAVVAYTIVDIMVHPGAYRAVGLDPKQAREVARANPHHHETRRFLAEKIVAFLTEVGMIGGPSKRLWRKAHLL
jgi:hypothetical protein